MISFSKLKTRKEKYDLYLKSPLWKKKRFICISFYKYTCQGCFQEFPQNKLDVHHLTYKRFGRESEEDLIPLCRPCHLKEHSLDKPKDVKKNKDKPVEYYTTKKGRTRKVRCEKARKIHEAIPSDLVNLNQTPIFTL
jgi:5-methylcytosine-specific restriction endonuclease McrA